MNESNEADDEQHEPSDKQIYSILSFYFMLVLIGVPLWWKTTEVYRVSLPYSEIDRLHELSVKIQMNIHIVAIEDSRGADLVNELKNIFRVSKLYEVSIRQHPFNRAVVGSSKTLEELDEKIKHPKFEGSIQLFEVPGLNRFSPHNIILGQNRTIYFSSDTDAYGLYNFLMSNILNEDALLTRASQVSQQFAHKKSHHSKHKIPSSEDFDILFTVLNPEPETLDINFNVQKAIKDYVTPFLKDLKDMNEFHLKSQWLYFVNLQVQSKFVNTTNKGPHFALSEELLPQVITPLEKKLASQVSNHPCLNFVLYVPSCSDSPLHIYTRKGFPLNGANAFISPRWGGIQIYNPTRQSCLNENAVVNVDEEETMSVFLEQLRHLLGVSEPGKFTEEYSTISSVFIRSWEKDLLLKSRTIEQLTSAKQTLQSLSKLLGKISNIVINDRVGNAIYAALENINNATEDLSMGKLFSAFKNSKKAFLLSEKAFSDPSLLALLYFPDDQKYAVYIPLFLPVMIPVVISARHIKKWIFKKFRKKMKTKKE